MPEREKKEQPQDPNQPQVYREAGILNYFESLLQTKSSVDKQEVDNLIWLINKHHYEIREDNEMRLSSLIVVGGSVIGAMKGLHPSALDMIKKIPGADAGQHQHNPVSLEELKNEYLRDIIIISTPANTIVLGGNTEDGFDYRSASDDDIRAVGTAVEQLDQRITEFFPPIPYPRSKYLYASHYTNLDYEAENDFLGIYLATPLVSENNQLKAEDQSNLLYALGRFYLEDVLRRYDPQSLKRKEGMFDILNSVHKYGHSLTFDTGMLPDFMKARMRERIIDKIADFLKAQDEPVDTSLIGQALDEQTSTNEIYKNPTNALRKIPGINYHAEDYLMKRIYEGSLSRLMAEQILEKPEAEIYSEAIAESKLPGNPPAAESALWENEPMLRTFFYFIHQEYNKPLVSLLSAVVSARGTYNPLPVLCNKLNINYNEARVKWQQKMADLQVQQ